MLLNILNNNYSLRTKILFAFIRLVSRYPVPDAAKLAFFRPEYYSNLMKKFTHKAMRGNSDWSIADRELMAAFVSKLNQCPFCIGAHTATAALAYNDKAKVSSVLSDLKTAPIEKPLKSVLQMLGKLTKENSITAEDIHEVLSAGVSPDQIEDALAVCFAFNTTDRLANAFGFEILTPEGFEAGAKFLLKRGYR